MLARRVLPLDRMRLPQRLIVVRRGETEVFREVVDTLDRWPEGTGVIWDRRGGERRKRRRMIPVERREGQRRAEADSMWHTHGFVVADTAVLPAEAVQLPPVDHISTRA
jgi:hypothetical protein